MRNEDCETLGQALRRARLERGLTVQQIAATTRIPARHLEALERNDTDAVPGGLYLRAEIRTYADAVGLNQEVALDLLRAATDPPPVAQTETAATAPSVPRRGPLWPVLIGGLCVIIAAILTWSPAREAPQTPPRSDAPPTRAVDATRGPELSGTTGVAAVLDAPAVPVPDPSLSAATEETELEIVTEPAGARVTIDGVGWDTSPVTIRYVSPGIKRLRVTRDGYAADERLIRVSSDQPRTRVHIALRAAD